MRRRQGRAVLLGLAGLVLTGLPGAALAQVNDREEELRAAQEQEQEQGPAQDQSDGPSEPQQPVSERDQVADLPQTRYDAEGKLVPPICVLREDGTQVCRRLVIAGRSRPASLVEAPWQVSLWSFKYTDYTAQEYRLKPEWMRRHKCGGTLIAPEWVLTAAHCLTGTLADHPFQVRIGSTALTDPRGRLFAVKQKIIHPDYDPVNKQHDIALLRIAPVRLPGVRPVSLLGSNGTAGVADNSEVMIFGFGKTRTAEASALLLKARIRVWPRGDCRTAMRALAARITPSVLCALGDDGSDTCQGDSGGPLIVGEGPAAVQAGVVSWGKGCGGAGSPGVYAYVSAYLPWIWKATRGRAGRANLPRAM